jgi:hypothetical protein
MPPIALSNIKIANEMKILDAVVRTQCYSKMASSKSKECDKINDGTVYVISVVPKS